MFLKLFLPFITMKKKHFRFLSLVFFLIGILLLINSTTNITGAVVGVSNISLGLSSILGIVFILASTALFVSGESLDDLFYEDHAFDRMKERKIFPSIIKDAIEYGEHYKLKKQENFGEAKGATDVYIKRHTADILPGKGNIGERIITIREPSEEREYKNIIVLTEERDVIKTVYVRNDKELEAFFNRYIR